ncbi:MAG: hypothetical protein LBE76_03780 [Nitrososphaerota archaeon]|jgi:hypothetical protein|nr:hypothetical protein [Nitrososphaerota archaeon]
MGQQHLFETKTQLEKLSKLGNPLLKANKIVNWEIFRKPIEETIHSKDPTHGGRPPYDIVLMFKIVMLQQWCGL